MKIGINCLSVKTNYVGGVTSFTLGILDGFLKLIPIILFKYTLINTITISLISIKK